MTETVGGFWQERPKLSGSSLYYVNISPPTLSPYSRLDFKLSYIISIIKKV